MNIEVFINEEYGYRAWKWNPGMTEQEFVGWFKDLTDSDIIKFYFNIQALPGKIVPWPEKQLVRDEGAKTRTYGDPRSFQPYYYMHFHDVDDTFIAVGQEVMRRRPTMKYDWKAHWIDHQIRAAKWAEQNAPNCQSAPSNVG
jgi:hypothetical protein